MKSIGTNGNVNSLNIGGSNSVQSSNMQLMADMRGNVLCSTFRNMSAPATSNTGYTPSGSNKFYATGIVVQSITGGNDPDVRLGYGDTNVNFGSAALPTNAWGIGYGSMSAVADGANMLNFSPGVTVSNPGNILFIPILIPFPNGKYPFVVWNNNLSAGDTVMMFGYEAP